MSRYPHIKLDRRRWRLTRWQVLVRDQWTCTRCGRVGGRLEVHHIVPLVKLDPEKPNAAYDPEGLRTLCRNCHFRETDRERGRGPGPQGLAEIDKWRAFVQEKLIPSCLVLLNV